MPQQGGQCPFCQLIQNPEQLLTVGESENFYAWLEVNPRARGHTMIVPKEHKENVLEFSSEEWTEAFNLTREVVEKAKQGLDADGASITVNIEEAGGQMLPHAYIQVFPRFQSDENAGTPTGAIFPQREDLQQQLESIQGDMASASVDIGGGKTKEAHPESQNFKDPASKLGDIGGEEPEEEEEKDEAEEIETPDEESDEESVKTEKVADAGELSEKELIEELIQRSGSVDELLRSDQFQQLFSQSSFELRETSHGHEKDSLNWL